MMTASTSFDAYISSFAGIAPLDDPKLAVLVKIDEPKSVPWGTVVAAPAFGRLVERHLPVARRVALRLINNHEETLFLQADPDRPVLRITGMVIMGGVSVETRLPGESSRDARKREKREVTTAFAGGALLLVLLGGGMSLAWFGRLP